MYIERSLMEVNEKLNRSISVTGGKRKHSLREIAARVGVAGSMFLSSCGVQISPKNPELDDSSNPPAAADSPEETETSSPAIVPTEEGEIIEITTANYPTSAENLIIDKRLNDEKMELIKEWAPDDVEKEIALFDAEFEREGIDLEDIRYKASIVDGKSWVLYPYNRRTGEGYIVSIDGVIRASIDLFGYLDRSPDDDFFDLIPVNIDKAEVVGDTSGWHVFAKIRNGQIIQWYDAVHDRVETIEIEPTATPEKDIVLKNIINRNEYPRLEAFSRITLQESFSSKLFELEDKWLDDNPFSEKAVPFTNLRFFTGPIDLRKNAGSEPLYQIDTKSIQIILGTDYSDPETRPIQTISFYVLWDEDLFGKLGYTDSVFEENKVVGVSKDYKFANLGIMSWAWLNPDKSSVKGRSLVSLGSSTILDNISEIIPMPLIDVYNYKEFAATNIITDEKALLEIYKIYPELKPPDHLTTQWVETGVMSKELENYLFGLAPITTEWEQNRNE